MTEHPENEEWMNELIRSVSSQELVDVWCLGCKDWRKMNNGKERILSRNNLQSKW